MKREDVKVGMVLYSKDTFQFVKIASKPDHRGYVDIIFALDQRCDISKLRPLTAREKGEGKP